MSRSARSRAVALAVAFAAPVVLAGCGSSVDLAKVTFSRTTIPAGEADPSGQRGAAPPDDGPLDAAFAMEKLRQVEPCALLEEKLLGTLGTPAESRPSGYSKCSNYMKDKAGKKLNITIIVGDTLIVDQSKLRTVVGGLRANVQKLSSGSTCFVRVPVQGGRNALGLSVQAGVADGDPCQPARRVAEAVTTKIRRDPPRREAEAGTLAGVDPCQLLDGPARAEAIGGAGTERRFGLYQCTYSHGGVDLRVSFDLGSDPASRNGDKVDLGGVTAFQRRSDNVYPSCELQWKHRRAAGNRSEVARVKLENVQKLPELDVCGKAAGAARALLPKLPRP
ncbi:DUF3558 family protein [Longimycelium tulufanense]|uniref:DUF3558 family protein n=1 Tax=Longimycelium tulufanense TaxID=907463 RepID=UPI00166803A2|nr:DUF3558 family protein [Longimycelium tulufanense]